MTLSGILTAKRLRSVLKWNKCVNIFEKNDSLKIFIDAQKTIYLKSIIQKIDVVIPQKIKSELLRDLLKYYKINNYNLLVAINFELTYFRGNFWINLILEGIMQ